MIKYDYNNKIKKNGGKYTQNDDIVQASACENQDKRKQLFIAEDAPIRSHHTIEDLKDEIEGLKMHINILYEQVNKLEKNND